MKLQYITFTFQCIPGELVGMCTIEKSNIGDQSEQRTCETMS